jgi:hypothetical protein
MSSPSKFFLTFITIPVALAAFWQVLIQTILPHLQTAHHSLVVAATIMHIIAPLSYLWWGYRAYWLNEQKSIASPLAIAGAFLLTIGLWKLSLPFHTANIISFAFITYVGCYLLSIAAHIKSAEWF